ncbi:MAG: tripartite tricarboxylate transporter substrate binding protein [Methylibium sp.]|uniref:tripartite tricarboxylate transporter substrate binding protein n=1 Tax=Methylibium sp. TaxID=2067992 RepID=UPI0017EDE2BF|nr:tripartite tricarboxylate transporter substrate binding protein [Methylibium sp.]MBA3598734.1 tripartite tricarboxylate transporter substrate binding protein [Methylibium sp.]
MKLLHRITLPALLTALLFAAAGTAQAQAQSYPDKPIRIIVPYPPGGFNDTLARTVGAKLQDGWGQTVTVENRPGGATLIGTDAAAKSAPDGYTLFITPFAFAVNQSIFKKLPYDPIKDFAPITLAASTPNLLVLSPTVPANSVKELIALAKSKPGFLSYASTGIGSSNHLSMELFKQMAGVDIVHVPYKGSGPAVTDLLGGQVGLMFDNVPNIIQHVKAGKLKALAVTTPKASPHAPGVPTVAESGVPGYEVEVWFGFAAPAGTPQPILDKLNTKIVEILNMPDVKAKFAGQGVDVIGSTQAEFAAHLTRQSAMWAKVVRDAGVTPE